MLNYKEIKNIPDLNLRSSFYSRYKSNLFFLGFYLSFVLLGFWTFRNTLSDIVFFDSFNKLVSSLFAFPEKGLFSNIIFILIRFLISISPILIITFAEFILSEESLKRKFNNLSIVGVFYPGERKYADLWFYFIEVIKDSFPFIITFLTLGSSVFFSEISTWFNAFYEKIIPIGKNSLSSSLIIILTILLSNLISYLRHRIAHNIPAIWDLHELHHSSTKMTIFSLARNAPLEDILTLPLFIPLSALSGLLLNQYLSQGFVTPLVIYIIYTSLDIIFTTVGHSSFKLIYPRPFRYLFMSPSLHWIHHSNNPEHYNCNFSNTLTVWDRFFGTFRDESHLNNIKDYGINDSEYNRVHPIYAATMLPIIKLKRRLNKSI